MARTLVRLPCRAGASCARESEVEAAVAAAPEEPVPQVWLADLETDRDVRRERAKSLVQRFPTSAEACVFLARVLREDRTTPTRRV